MFCLDISDSIDKLNELNSCEIRRLNIDVAFGVVAVAVDCFCYMDSERLPALSTICLFGCLARVCFTLVCLLISLPFIQLLFFLVRDIRLLFKLLVKFEMY